MRAMMNDRKGETDGNMTEIRNGEIDCPSKGMQNKRVKPLSANDSRNTQLSPLQQMIQVQTSACVNMWEIGHYALINPLIKPNRNASLLYSLTHGTGSAPVARLGVNSLQKSLRFFVFMYWWSRSATKLKRQFTEQRSCRVKHNYTTKREWMFRLYRFPGMPNSESITSRRERDD